MEANKTKEKNIKEILSGRFGYDFESDWWTDELKTLFDEINSANDFYYKKLILEKDKEIERLMAELSELKEKHKEEIIEAYLEGVNSTGQLGEGMGIIIDINDAEQYYTQTYGQ